ncbi:hypothetical protein FRZ67_11630 [Panacibacter ginsenosidivorans]|uniref:Uncharacterized protein n=1 Tax=Panacibacter ginsenosidivorans TaxID=1813871 RepID=A0A5B8VCB1_9BACT|nr:hypothetical protein [Panacibacter ginsenosidivorans]QEC67918.1 hypothetical protein FRZ67_11630 [Panacibacter ginsenosidivorans]
MSENSIQHSISLQQAIDMTTLYRANRPAAFPICETFEKSSVLALLSHVDAAYLRVYYGMKASGEVDAILVVANSENEDILSESDTNEIDSTETLILEDGFRCPQYCPPSSPLNT